MSGSMMHLNVIVASTRPGRMGLAVGTWFHGFAAAHGGFEAHLVDLETVALPMYDEAKHPRLGDYAHDHTKAWSGTIAAADAFVFVAPEYNHFPAPSLVNALDFLFHEWACKPAAFVSYGGASGGLRAAHILKPMLTALKIMPIPESVMVPMVPRFITEGVFVPAEAQETSAKAMLDELARWAAALKPMRG